MFPFGLEILFYYLYHWVIEVYQWKIIGKFTQNKLNHWNVVFVKNSSFNQFTEKRTRQTSTTRSKNLLARCALNNFQGPRVWKSTWELNTKRKLTNVSIAHQVSWSSRHWQPTNNIMTSHVLLLARLVAFDTKRSYHYSHTLALSMPKPVLSAPNVVKNSNLGLGWRGMIERFIKISYWSRAKNAISKPKEVTAWGGTKN